MYEFFEFSIIVLTKDVLLMSRYSVIKSLFIILIVSFSFIYK